MPAAWHLPNPCLFGNSGCHAWMVLLIQLASDLLRTASLAPPQILLVVAEAVWDVAREGALGRGHPVLQLAVHRRS